MMTYIKCRWDDNQGELRAGWGGSWWYFEFDPDGSISRQIEIYDNGMRLRYGPDRLEDANGRLGEGRRQHMDMPGALEMTADEFEAVWASVK
jgi:hypothetical protein